MNRLVRRPSCGQALRLARVLVRFARHRSGTAALEFAAAGTAFFALVLLIIALGFRLYVHVALDYASSRAARLLAVDSTQSRSTNAAAFQSVTFCPLLSAFLACANVSIALQPVTDFSNASALGPGPPPFSPGQGGSLMLLRVTYQVPALSWPVPGGGGGAASFAGASVTIGYPYQNEY